MSLVKKTLTFSGLTLISRVLGFVRDVLSARYLGAGLVADCFFIAFKLPNFFRRLFAEGAFNAAFVPLFTGELASRDGDGLAGGMARAKGFAEEALAVLVPVLILFTALVEIFMGPVLYLLTGGFADAGPDKQALAVELTRLTFPYLMLISLVSLLAGVLNALEKFAAAAAAPILLNLTLIGSLLVFNDSALLTGMRLAAAVSVAGLVQLIWLIYAVRRIGMLPRLRLPRLTPRVKTLLRVFWPAAIGAGVIQINLLIDVILAARFLPEGSISYLFYADRLNQLPIGVIGVAVATVLLPLMAKEIKEGHEVKAAQSQNRAVELALFLTLPAAVALILLPAPFVGVLYEHGSLFGAAEARATSLALTAYALGLPAYILAKVLTPGFFARHDTKTPLRFAIVALLLNTVLNLILMGPLGHVGFALATAISAWVNVGLLYGALRRRGHFRMDGRLVGRMLRMILSSIAMAVCLIAMMLYLAPWLAAGGLTEIAAVAVLVLTGMGVYGGSALLTGAMTRREFATLLGRRS